MGDRARVSMASEGDHSLFYHLVSIMGIDMRILSASISDFTSGLVAAYLICGPLSGDSCVGL